jgi:hypothetical protein
MADTTAADLTASTHPAAALLASIEPELASRVAVVENAQSAILPSAITRKYLGTPTHRFSTREQEKQEEGLVLGSRHAYTQRIPGQDGSREALGLCCYGSYL